MADPELELRANRMDLVTRWADDIAHEIKNPIHAMVINLELVKRRAAAADPEPLIRRAEVVETELHRVHGLVESLLRLVRPWGDRDRADVDAVFNDLLPVLRARAMARKIEFGHQPGGGTVAIAPGLLTMVLLNLVDNAMAATPEGGAVTTACQVAGADMRITVLDTGAGIPDQVAGRAFDIGVTTRPGHAGLGLAIVRRLVDQAGGSITIRPAPGDHGTLATIVLPRVGAA
jgi:two-component system, NtrC family, sensor histidine kinase HydH